MQGPVSPTLTLSTTWRFSRNGWWKGGSEVVTFSSEGNQPLGPGNVSRTGGEEVQGKDQRAPPLGEAEGHAGGAEEGQVSFAHLPHAYKPMQHPRPGLHSAVNTARALPLWKRLVWETHDEQVGRYMSFQEVPRAAERMNSKSSKGLEWLKHGEAERKGEAAPSATGGFGFHTLGHFWRVLVKVEGQLSFKGCLLAALETMALARAVGTELGKRMGQAL